MIPFFRLVDYWDRLLDPQTKNFTEPPEQIKQVIAALKNAKPIQFKENIALVVKYLDKLPPLMEQRPAD